MPTESEPLREKLGEAEVAVEVTEEVKEKEEIAE